MVKTTSEETEKANIFSAKKYILHSAHIQVHDLGVY